MFIIALTILLFFSYFEGASGSLSLLLIGLVVVALWFYGIHFFCNFIMQCWIFFYPCSYINTITVGKFEEASGSWPMNIKAKNCIKKNISCINRLKSNNKCQCINRLKSNNKCPCINRLKSNNNHDYF